MSEKVVLHYIDGRGKMEPIRWLLAAAGVEVCSDSPRISKTKSGNRLTLYIYVPFS